MGKKEVPIDELPEGLPCRRVQQERKRVTELLKKPLVKPDPFQVERLRLQKAREELARRKEVRETRDRRWMRKVHKGEVEALDEWFARGGWK